MVIPLATVTLHFAAKSRTPPPAVSTTVAVEAAESTAAAVNEVVPQPAVLIDPGVSIVKVGNTTLRVSLGDIVVLIMNVNVTAVTDEITAGSNSSIVLEN